MTNEALEYLKPFTSFSQDKFPTLQASLSDLGSIIKEKAQVISSEVASKSKDFLDKLKDKMDKKKDSHGEPK